jgi:DNA-binding MarR family transcriptional regulator
MPHDARSVAQDLHAAAIHLLRRVRRVDIALGVGPAALSALSVLVFGGPRSLSRLADAEGVRVPTMSRIVAGLVRAGLVHREPDPADHRAGVLHATIRGRAMLRRGRRRRVAELTALLARLDERRLRALGQAAALIERVLNANAPGRGRARLVRLGASQPVSGR